MESDRYIGLIQRNFPQIAIQSARPITRGWDSFVLDINDALIFRFPMRDDVIPYLEKEMPAARTGAGALDADSSFYVYRAGR